MDIKDLAKEKEDEWQELFNRMDDDRYLLQLEPFIMTDEDGVPVPGVLHTTLNDPAMFGAWVNAELMATKETWRVSSDDLNDSQTSNIEDWIKYRFVDADKRLRNSGSVNLNPFLFEQSTYRGREAVRCITLDDGTLDLLPLDTRYMTWDADSGGLNWVAPWYYRTRSMIAKDYPDFTWDGKDDTRAKVYDYWYKEKVGNNFQVFNQVTIQGKDVYETPQKTEYDYIPFVIETVPVGSFLQDEDNQKRKGESIYWLARDVIPVLNEIITVMRSMSFRSYLGVYTWDQEGKPPPTPVPGDVAKIKEGTKGLTLVQMQGLEQASIRLFAILDQRLQAATRSRIEEGTLQFTMSAVGIKDLRAERDKLYTPRLTATALMKLGLQDMFTRQAIQLNKNIEVNQQMFKISDLKKDYRVMLEYNTLTPKDDTANWALSNAIGPSLSLDSKLRSIVKVDDVDRELQLLHDEATQAAEPAVFFYERAHEYVSLGDKSPDESEKFYNIALMLAKKGAALWAQLPDKPPVTAPPEGSGQAGAILPSLIGGQSGQSNTRTDRQNI